MTTPIFATGARSRLAIVAETTPGTTPATPTMLVLPEVKFDLAFSQSTYKDTSIFGDRMERDVIAGLRKVGGSFSANLSATNFSPIIQTAMSAAWVSNVIKTGTTLQTITMEDWHADITEGFLYTGCFADKLQIKVPVNNIVTIDATISGMNMTTESAVAGTTYTAAVAETPYVATTATITEGGAAIAYITAIDLTIDNGAAAVDALGSVTPIGYTLGMSTVTGTVTAYIPDLTLFNKYMNQTQTAITFTLTDGTNTLEFNLPNVVYTSGKVSVSGQANLPVSLAFTAVRDASTSSNIVITRS